MTDLPPNPDTPAPPPTLDDVQKLIGDALAQMTGQVGDIAKRTLDLATKRLGVVASWARDTNIAQVVVDGDTAATPMQNGTGLPLLPDQRVVIDFYPPHGVLVTGVLELAGAIPVGALIWMDTATPPEGFLGPCDGDPFDVATYPDLAAYLGGGNLPNYQNRFFVHSGADHALSATGGSPWLVQHTHPVHIDSHIGPGVFTQENPNHYAELRVATADIANLPYVTESPHIHELDVAVDVDGDTDDNALDTDVQLPPWVGLNVFIKF